MESVEIEDENGKVLVSKCLLRQSQCQYFKNRETDKLLVKGQEIIDLSDLLDCASCNKEGFRDFKVRQEQIKQGKVDLENEYNQSDRFEPIKTPFVQRTLLLDIPENLLINMKRFSCANKYVSKTHVELQIEMEIWLDDVMIHEVQKDEKLQQEWYEKQAADS